MNKAVQNLLRNLGSQLVINSLERPQSIKSNLLRKACAHCSADHVYAALIKVTRFKNLQVTHIIALYFSFDRGNARTKSRVSVKNGTGDDSIG